LSFDLMAPGKIFHAPCKDSGEKDMNEAQTTHN
jgi:hypothetical protein